MPTQRKVLVRKTDPKTGEVIEYYTKDCSKPKKRKKVSKLHPRFRRRMVKDYYYLRPKPDSDHWYEREPRDAWMWAKKAYFADASIADIRKKTGYPTHVVRLLIYGPGRVEETSIINKVGWFHERLKANWEAIKMNRIDKLKGMVDTQLDLIEGAQKEMRQLGVPLEYTHKAVTMAKELQAMEKTELGAEKDPLNVNIQVEFTAKGVKELYDRLKNADEGLIEYEKEGNIYTPQFERIEAKVEKGE